MTSLRTLAAMALLVGMLALWPAAAAASSATEARSASLVDSTICGLLDGSRFQTTVRRVISRGTSNRWYGPLLANIVLESANYLCPEVLGIAKRVVLDLFRKERPGASSSVDVWNIALPDLAAVQTASALGVDSTYVGDAVSDLCADVRSGRNPVTSLARWFPNARLRFLRGLNGVVSLAARRCDLLARSISSLSSAVLQLVLSKESAADIDPPAAWFTSFASGGRSGGSTRVTAYFAGADRGSGLARFVVWISYSGTWRRLTENARGPGWQVDIPSRRSYKWAVQAIDRAGNRGPVAYSRVGTS